MSKQSIGQTLLHELGAVIKGGAVIIALLIFSIIRVIGFALWRTGVFFTDKLMHK